MNRKRPKILLSAIFALAVSSSLAIAQQYMLDLAKPEIITDLYSPGSGNNVIKKSDWKPKQWVELELKFKVKADPKLKVQPKFVDKVSVTWYIAIKHPELGGKNFVLLEKQVNHVNVPVDEDVYVSVYLSPNSIKRMTGNDKLRKNDLEEVGGVILVNGVSPVQNTGFFSLKTQKTWWTSGRLSSYNKINLLNKNETPFKNYWVDRYAEIDIKE